MTTKPSAEQRRKHEKIDEEIHKHRVSLAQVRSAASVSLEAYQILQELLVGLRRRRAEKGLSLDAVAKASGIDKAYLSRLENGKVINPTFETLCRYASAIRPLRSMRDLVTA
jgi:hypothetical protein